MATTKPLKIWNGRGYCCRKYEDPAWEALRHNAHVHAYVCAASRADARRVIEEYCGRLPPDSELKEYFHEGSWGNDMAGVAHERGLWIRFGDHGKPQRVI